MPTRDALTEELFATDDEYRRLHEEHHQCEIRLAELAQKSLLSQQDEIEEKQIKRHKLSIKDRMAELMREHEPAQMAV